MARLTRVEQRAATRAAILTAARVRFLRDGYAATSLDQIADDAGFSKGAVYSNFRDKPNLCREVLLGIHAEKRAQVSSITTAPGEVTDLINTIEEWLEKTFGDPGWTMLEMEFAVAARGNPEQNHMITAIHEGIHTTITDAIRALATRTGTNHFDTTTLNEMTDLIVATALGVGVRRAVNPAITMTPAIHAIRKALSGKNTLTHH
ncbi:TetR/AcrR family transcriptional regulator [Mycobacterium sp.]|uniref:TetR/AcrR family transcriptional regulator n=1 Tax=Mycobacterium sp. TaxID=1785 RepID=UPI003BA906D4